MIPHNKIESKGSFRFREKEAEEIRNAATKLATERGSAIHANNGDEVRYRSRSLRSFASFTKGLQHDNFGLVGDWTDATKLRNAIDSGKFHEFDSLILGGFYDPNQRDPSAPPIWKYFSKTTNTRKWEAPTAGFVYSLQGPDSQSVTMPPAPSFVPQLLSNDYGSYASPSSELAVEQLEVYALALLRDEPFTSFEGMGSQPKLDMLIKYFSTSQEPVYTDPKNPRFRLAGDPSAELSPQTIFRGATKGDLIGPYLSQFLLLGSNGINSSGIGDEPSTQGLLDYGALKIDMRVRVAAPRHDFMTCWNEYLDVQNGADVLGLQEPFYTGRGKIKGPKFRFIATPRDLATYVHFDALYEAYLNATLFLLAKGAPFDPHFVPGLGSSANTAGFALWGGPHILTLVTEVATRALKAVRYQKFNNHLRARPEALAGLYSAYVRDKAFPKEVADAARAFFDGLEKAKKEIIDSIRTHNESQNAKNKNLKENLPLLPMAFQEGSPMHPAYGAGHATVAGACVTIVKAFFDEEAVFALEPVTKSGGKGNKEGATTHKRLVIIPPSAIRRCHEPIAYVPELNKTTQDSKLVPSKHFKKAKKFLTVGDELNKLAANISIGRNMAGVHFYSDYIDSLRMGEEIAINMLQEQAICYQKDSFGLSLTKFDNKTRVVIQ